MIGGLEFAAIRVPSNVYSLRVRFGVHHLAHVPQLDALVLAVGDEVPPVAAAVDVRQPLHVAHQHAHRGALLAVALQHPPVPYLAGATTTASRDRPNLDCV